MAGIEPYQPFRIPPGQPVRIDELDKIPLLQVRELPTVYMTCRDVPDELIPQVPVRRVQAQADSVQP
jgi:hypothetical protein